MSDADDEKKFKDFESRFKSMEETQQIFTKQCMVILTAARAYRDGHIEDGTMVDVVMKSMQMFMGETLLEVGMRQMKFPPDLMKTILTRDILEYNKTLPQLSRELSNLILLMIPSEEKSDGAAQG